MIARGTSARIAVPAPSDEALRRVAVDFRGAIERSIAERASPHLPYFPDGACTLVSWLLALHLRGSGVLDVRFVSGHFPGKESYARHAWLVVDGSVVDLTADPFGQPPVVVGAPTPFHDSLDEREERDAFAAIDAFTPDEAARYRRLLAPLQARLSA